MDKISTLSYKRVYKRIFFRTKELEYKDQDINQFFNRLITNWDQFFTPFYKLYGHRYDFFYHLEETVVRALLAYTRRPIELKNLDTHREKHKNYFSSEKMVGGAIYVDLFSKNLSKLKKHVPYLKKMGLTVLHLMPLFAVRAGDSDGGYAVSNYRSINPSLGTMEELKELSALFRDNGISLVLDFVFNHTSDEHDWAKRALNGDQEYQDYYFMFPNKNIPNQYERNLREIFPTVRRGNFTWNKDLKKWIWTTFNSFQWDLNYSNPSVFTSMVDEMFFLANRGVEILRLDAVPFIWKKMGTNCENLEEVHLILEAFNALAKISCPSLLLLSEAIVHPDEVKKYMGKNKCQLSYNPLLMALLWEALATRETKLLNYSLIKRFNLEGGCLWINYLRCHDDIGWTFDDEDAQKLGINPYNHRHFLNEFYTGQFDGSFGWGIPFQFNPENSDMRIAGTLASLAGLEQAIVKKDPLLQDMAVKRILLLRSIVLSIGGIPLIYLGEEWGTLNDYSYISDPAKTGDSRWLHRPKTKWSYLKKWKKNDTIENTIYNSLMKLIRLRKKLSALSGTNTEFVDTKNPHLFGYIRQNKGKRVFVICNFSEEAQILHFNLLRIYAHGNKLMDRISGEEHFTTEDLVLSPYQFLWLENKT